METKICKDCKVEKPITDFRPYTNTTKRRTMCRSCENEWNKKYCKEHKVKKNQQNQQRRHLKNITRPFNENKTCPCYLGIHVSENVLSTYFEGVTRMPYGTPGYDFICKRGYMIDVKSACLSKRPAWQFHIDYNTTANYFLCLGFDNRDSLNPEHIWLIPGEKINHLHGLTITKSDKVLAKWKPYERDLGPVIKQCNTFRK